jgi:SH3 domain protein
MECFVRLVWLGLLGQLLLASMLHARTMYVSDTFEIVLRSEKEVAGRNVIKIIPTGTPVEVIDMDESWATIQLSEDRTGYVLKRYLIDRLPYKLTSERLQEEVEQQKSRLATLTEQLTTLQKEHQGLQRVSTTRESQLTDTAKKYEQLRKDASQYLQLKAEYTNLENSHNLSQEQLTELNDAHLLLKKSRNLLWFLSGAGVMLAGWIIGMITEHFRGRRRRQGGSSYQLPH